jgi:hypothetical protein
MDVTGIHTTPSRSSKSVQSCRKSSEHGKKKLTTQQPVIIIITIITKQQRTSTPTIPTSVTEYADITILWNKDRDVLANRPDITVKNKDDRICLLIDVGIPLNMDVMQKDVENRIQYKI